MGKSSAMIDVLMAAFNGERFLPEQLDSILTQTEQDFQLLWQDDGSTDETVHILAAYEDAHPDKIHRISGPDHVKSAKGNFMSLLDKSQADYVCFSDQDDRWRQDKLETTLAAMRAGEKQYGKETPLLVHTDLAVVDENLAIIAPSFFQYQKLNPNQNNLNRLLVQNHVTGCTMMINRSLALLLKMAPAKAMAMHDWWAAMAACAMGHILFLDKPTVDYRQHGRNQVGSQGGGLSNKFFKAVSQGGETRHRLFQSYGQAEDFLACYISLLPEEMARSVARYSGLGKAGKAKRIETLIRFGYLKQGVFPCLGQLFFC